MIVAISHPYLSCPMKMYATSYEKKTVRVTTINVSTTLSNYFSDQLSYEQKIEEMVDSGDITPVEADEKTEEWEGD
jgi:hypothetical protein